LIETILEMSRSAENNETSRNPMKIALRKRKVDRHTYVLAVTFRPRKQPRKYNSWQPRGTRYKFRNVFSGYLDVDFRRWPETPSLSNGLFITLLAANGPPLLDAYKHEERRCGDHA